MHTRARHEKAVVAELSRQNIHCYLPLVRVPRSYGRRHVVAELPLFPGYVFLNGGPPACEVARRTNRVASILAVGDQDGLRAELRQIQRVVESGAPTELCPGLREGRRCRVIGGSLKGLEGVVLRRQRRYRLHLAVTILGQSAVVEIDGALVEPID